MTRALPVFIACAVLASACKKPQASGERSESVAAPARHSATEHAHESPHGGVVKSTARGHLELVASKDGAMRVYLLDETLGTRPVAGTKGTVKVAIPGYEDVALSEAGDHLAGKGAPISGAHVTAVVSLYGGEVKELARFRLHLEARSGTARREERGPGLSATPPEERQSVVGLVTDSTCLVRGEATSEEHSRECAVRCIQGGAPIVIVEEKTEKVFVATAPQGRSVIEALLPFVGQRVEVYGKVVRQGGTQFLVVEDAVPEHEHTSKEGGTVAMAGDLHLEVLALEAGEVRVHLSDDFRRPLPVTGRRGSVEVRAGSSPVVSAPLAPSAQDRYLAARFAPFGAGPLEVTIRVAVPDDPSYFITFMLDPIAEPRAAEKAPAVVAAVTDAEGVQEVRVEVKGGFSPGEVALKRGVPARLVFLRQDTGACSSEVLIPGLEVKQELVAFKETVVSLTPMKAGEFELTCGMHMMRGKVIVRD